MKQKTITITIDANGGSDIDLNGFEGRGYDKVVKDFRGGDAVTSARTKREYAIEPAKAQLKQGQ